MNSLLLSLIDFSAFSDTEAVLRMRAADPDGAFLWALMGVTMILLIAYFRQRISTGHGKTLPGAVLPDALRRSYTQK